MKLGLVVDQSRVRTTSILVLEAEQLAARVRESKTDEI